MSQGCVAIDGSCQGKKERGKDQLSYHVLTWILETVQNSPRELKSTNLQEAGQGWDYWPTDRDELMYHTSTSVGKVASCQ